MIKTKTMKVTCSLGLVCMFPAHQSLESAGGGFWPDAPEKTTYAKTTVFRHKTHLPNDIYHFTGKEVAPKLDDAPPLPELLPVLILTTRGRLMSRHSQEHFNKLLNCRHVKPIKPLVVAENKVPLRTKKFGSTCSWAYLLWPFGWRTSTTNRWQHDWPFS